MIDLSDDLGAGLAGSFAWDVHRDLWTWSDEGYRIHGYEPGSVEPTFDLAISHKLAAGRARAERVMSAATTPGFRYSHHHRIADTRGRERVVVSVGATALEEDGTRLVLRGFMVDITDRHDHGVGDALQRTDDVVRVLSRREREVLLLVAASRTNQEIADELFVSVNTIKTYLRTSYRKIGVSRRSQAVLWTVANQAQLAAL